MEKIFIVSEINDIEYGSRKVTTVFENKKDAENFIKNRISKRNQLDTFDEFGNYTFWNGKTEPWFIIEEFDLR